jgi:hypothetical protein
VKIEWGAGIVDGAGKLAGWVFSKNAAGSYARRKVTPTNPQTPSQMAARSRIVDCARAWATLTEAQRSDWNTWAKGHPVPGAFGKMMKLSGASYFNHCNTTRLLINQTIVDDAPTSAETHGPAANAGFAFTAADRTVLMTFAPSPWFTGHGFILFATPAYSPSISFVKGLYRFAGHSGNAPETPASFILPDSFGSFAVGDTISIKMVGVNYSNGLKAAPFIKELVAQ